MAERSAVNRNVAGSSPAWGAFVYLLVQPYRLYFFCISIVSPVFYLFASKIKLNGKRIN